ncbi:MFS transporter [Staphylococcus massiliensis CCUG 55927]|uniref:MDR family MFS transporter n=1 Tax=Staphylococcus massiliensis TaxID=555791 RepID=UPI00030B2F7A|nr:MDR family MFS transporter [Staphylococcus massiliensis]POA00657.1 MFS transporter [Staphylococcus massiliensis CCUG 55927]
MNAHSISTKQRNLIVGVMLLSAFVAILNQTLLNTALPAIMKGLHVDENTSQWLVTGFMLVNGIMVPLTAYLMDKVKSKTLYLLSMGAFLLGSVIAAFAPNFLILMIARVIQAMGAGVLMPLMQFTLFTLFPRDKRGFAMGLAGLVIQFAPAISPTLSGFLVDQYSWRTPFFVVVITAAICYILGALFITNYSETKDPKLDRISVVYSTVGFGIMLYAFSSAGNLGFFNPIVLISLVISIIIIYIFVKRQLRIRNPLLNLRVFKNRAFTLTTITSVIVFTAMVGPALLVPMYVQNSLGLSAMLSGIVILPGAIINGAMSLVTGKIFDKYGARRLVITGFVILTITTILHIFLDVYTPFWYLVVIYGIRMFSIALLMMPLNTAGINALESKDISHGTAIMNSARIISSSIGTALMVTIMSIGMKLAKPDHNGQISEHMAYREAVSSGISLAFIITSILVTIGLIMSFYIKDRDPNQTNVNTRQI